MNTRIGAWVWVMFVSVPALAGTVAGTGGSTEYTQIANNLQLVLQYEQQVQSYIRQGLQLQNEIRNLQKNPFSLLGSDIGNLINSTGRIMSGANSIGGNLSQIDKNFATTFKNPTAATLAANFRNWHTTSTSTLEGALKAAGMHRDQFSNDTEAINGLYTEAQNTGGNVEALQVLAKINTKQLQQNQALGDLISAQNIAASTYMATETAKNERTNTDWENYMRTLAAQRAPENSTELPKTVYKKWNLY